VNNPRLKKLRCKVVTMMDKAKDNGMDFSINHIPCCEDNVEADRLANMGMEWIG